ncbi:MAG: tRNA (N6-threonylcarbamoyladenosine(37)-N6)-methyltransferase TrmO [Bacteroidia bacterium]
MEIILSPVAIVKNIRKEPIDDHWGEITAEIELVENIPTEAFDHISDFSHLEIIYSFNKVNSNDIAFSGRPRGNPTYPSVGIFAQRKKDRPNSIGLCTVELLAHKGRIITVKYLDAIDGTPVLDIKPVFREFQPRCEIKQPAWVSDLMKNYYL